MDIDTPPPAAAGRYPSNDGYAIASQLALAGEPEAALARCRHLTGADGLKLLAGVLLGRHHERVPLGPLPRIPHLDAASQYDLAHRLVAAAHLERDAFLRDGAQVVSCLLRSLLAREFSDPHPDLLQRSTLERNDHLGSGAEIRNLIRWTAQRLALSDTLAENAVVYLLSQAHPVFAVRWGVEMTRLAPALSHINLAADIVERLGLEDLARHLQHAFAYPPEAPTPELNDLPIEERYDLLFEPSLFDSEIRAAKDRELWLLLHADGFLDHPVVRARRAEFLIWAEEDDEALELVDGIDHPLAQAMYVKALVNIARDGGGYPEGLYRDARIIADGFREYALSSDPLVREAMMHMLEMLGAIAYYFDQDPATAAFFVTRSLHVAEELGVVDKINALRSQLKVTRKVLGVTEPTSDEPLLESTDLRRQELHAVVRLKTALRERHYHLATEIADAYFGMTHIPQLVKALGRYADLDYWGVGALLQEAENFRSDFHFFKALLTLQTYVRVGEVAYANPAHALEEISGHLGNLNAPFEVLADARMIFPLGLLLVAAHDRARGDVRREAELVPILRLSDEGRSGTWYKGTQVAVVPPGVLEDIYNGEARGDRPIEYFTGRAEHRNPFSNKDDLRRVRARHERVELDWRTCIPEITLYRALKRLEVHLPDVGFGRAAAAIEVRSPELLKYPG